MKNLIFFFMMMCAFPLHAQVRVAYIHGNVGFNGSTPATDGMPYDQMLLTDTSGKGCSMLKGLVESAGYQIDQYYDQTTTFDAQFLSQFNAIIFGLHQRVITAAEQAAIDTWLKAGGGLLVYNDAGAGGDYSIVPTRNQVGQKAVNSIISNYGMQVLVDQGLGGITLQSGPNATHPIVAGNLKLRGYGVSPIAVDPNSDAQILIPYGNPDYLVQGKMRIRYTEGLTINNPLWASLVVKPVGAGNIVAILDRQPFWNDENADIQDLDNAVIVGNIVKFLAGDPAAGVSDLNKEFSATEFDSESNPETTAIITATTDKAGNAVVGKISGNSWIQFNNFNFSSGSSSVKVVVANQNRGGQIQVRTGSLTGAVVATINVPAGLSWTKYQTLTANMNVSGTNNLVFNFIDTNGIITDLFGFKSFTVNAQ